MPAHPHLRSPARMVDAGRGVVLAAAWCGSKVRAAFMGGCGKTCSENHPGGGEVGRGLPRPHPKTKKSWGGSETVFEITKITKNNIKITFLGNVILMLF